VLEKTLTPAAKAVVQDFMGAVKTRVECNIHYTEQTSLRDVCEDEVKVIVCCKASRIGTDVNKVLKMYNVDEKKCEYHELLSGDNRWW
jgi:hypothetical protein